MRLQPLRVKTNGSDVLPLTMMIRRQQGSWQVSRPRVEGSGGPDVTTDFNVVLLEPTLRGTIPTLVFPDDHTIDAFLRENGPGIKTIQDYIRIMLGVPHQELVLTHDQVRTILGCHGFTPEATEAFLASPGTEGWLPTLTTSPSRHFRHQRHANSMDFTWDPAFFFRTAQWAATTFAITHNLKPDVFTNLPTVGLAATLWGTQIELKTDLPREEDSDDMVIVQIFKANGKPFSTPKLVEISSVKRRLRTLDFRVAGSISHDVHLETLIVPRPQLHSNRVAKKAEPHIHRGDIPLDVAVAGGGW